MRLYPGTKFSIGPAIENGFYYDFDLENPLSADDLPKIEAEIKKVIKENIAIERFELPAGEAKELMEGQPYNCLLYTSFSAGFIFPWSSPTVAVGKAFFTSSPYWVTLIMPLSSSSIRGQIRYPCRPASRWRWT